MPNPKRFRYLTPKAAGRTAIIGGPATLVPLIDWVFDIMHWPHPPTSVSILIASFLTLIGTMLIERIDRIQFHGDDVE